VRPFFKGNIGVKKTLNPSFHTPYYTQVRNELVVLSPRYSAKVTQLLQQMLKRRQTVCNAVKDLAGLGFNFPTSCINRSAIELVEAENTYIYSKP